MRYFLFKTEPEDYSLGDLERDGSVRWDCIRNYGARNRLRECEPGDLVLMYHSGREPGIVGLARVASTPYPDPTQFDEASDYHDAKATAAAPRWWAVDIEFVEAFDRALALSEMKQNDELSDLEVLRRQRLSVSEVTAAQFGVLSGIVESKFQPE